MKKFRRVLTISVFLVLAFFLLRHFYEERALKQIIARLEADSRVAEVLVTETKYDQTLQKNFTTIKFVEYNTQGKAMEAKYFTFPGNVIQFQSLVVRFNDHFVEAGDRLKGKSVYLFWKVFYLDGANTKEFPINSLEEIPGGYKIGSEFKPFEKYFWHEFWHYALDQETASKAGIKNAQIEAPGAVFVPGYLYTIKIEHDGGLRIDTQTLPNILNGERINK